MLFRSVQHRLHQVLFTGGLIRMSDEISKKPDVIQSSPGLLRGMDEVAQCCTIFMQIRNYQMTAAQSIRLSFTIAKLR